MPQINLLEPEFVINVGDLIEGYSDQVAELNTEWNEADAWLNELDMPFFKTPGNHDIANETARGEIPACLELMIARVSRERHQRPSKANSRQAVPLKITIVHRHSLIPANL